MLNIIKSDFSLITHPQIYQRAVESALDELSEHQIVKRIWERDFSVWKPYPDEISNRLGWLHSAENMLTKLPEIESFVESVHLSGYTNALLLGMGGSSLAPELFSITFPATRHALQVHVLDSTDPGSVLSYRNTLDPSQTLFIVSTKSGGTEETLSLFKYFYNLVLEYVGAEGAGNHFVAITDPASQLVDLAKEYSFRYIFVNDPNVGGRFSALTYFGLVPAALSGVDIKSVLTHTQKMMMQCGPATPDQENPAAILGVTLGELAKNGHDKATFFLSPQIASFGEWVEQLIAESTGKQGTGILPVIGEKLYQPGIYGTDRVFIHIQLNNDTNEAGEAITALSTLAGAGHPLLQIKVNELYDLAGQFFLWELATVIAGWRLQINPFDQPNVELAKIRARNMVKVYKNEKKLPSQSPAFADDRMNVFCNTLAKSPAEAITRLADSANSGDYLAIQAYIQSTNATDAALEQLRSALTKKTRLATTVGYGPRFLHSTGQLHKGDRGNGIFIQITADSPTDVPIPDQAGDTATSITFGVLIMAQALGDQEALLEQGRRVIRLHIKRNIPDTILALANEIN